MKRILNLGCGYDTYGTDFVDKYPSRPEIKRVDCDTQKLPYGNNTFDEVIVDNLLQHLANPHFALREVHRVLKPRGKFLIKVTNIHALYYHFSSILENYENFKNKCYSFYTRLSLRNALEKTGFKNIAIEYYNPSHKLKKHKLKICFFSLLSKKLFCPQLRATATK